MLKQFYFELFSLAKVHSLDLFDPLIGPCLLLTLQARVDQGSMAVKGYSAFPKAPALLESHRQIVCVISRTLVGEGFYLFAKMK